MLLCVVVLLLALWLEPELVKTALSPLVDVAICLAFILLFTVMIVVLLSLTVIAPLMLVLGIESRHWRRGFIHKTLHLTERKIRGSKRTL